MSGIPGGGGPSFEKPTGTGQPFPPAGAGQPGSPVPPAGGLGQPGPQGAATYELSGWWPRVGATLIDAIILMVPFIPLVLIVFAGLGLSIGSDGDANDAGVVATVLTTFLMIAVYAVVALIYAPYFMAKWNGQTPGRRAVGIRVVRADGGPMTFGFAALREVVVKQLGFGIASSFTLGLATLLDYLWALWDSENRCLHDLIVNTRVVRA